MVQSIKRVGDQVYKEVAAALELSAAKVETALTARYAERASDLVVK
jgi:hypothetical protein